MLPSNNHPSASTRASKRRARRAHVNVAIAVSVHASGCDGWGPLTSTYNGNTVVRASGYTNKSAQGVTDTFELQDPISDGNSVYGSARYLFWKSGSDGVYRWYTEAQDATPEISNKKATFTESAGLRTDSSRIRILSYACAQMGWPVPDSCSDAAIISYDY
jgi:hypothetical protein